MSSCVPEHRPWAHAPALRRALPLLLVALVWPSAAFAFKPATHQRVTQTGLAALRPDVVTRILAANRWQDIPLSLSLGLNAHHFNDCGFSQGAAFVQAEYARLAHQLLGGSPRAAETFGAILHAIQDLYAHSNWADTGVDALLSEVFAPGEAQWPALLPASHAASVVMVEGEMEGWTLLRQGRLVSATDRQGVAHIGIISGAVAHDMRCPTSVVVGHWDNASENKGLAKDDVRSPGYEVASALALRQTERELCRLFQLGDLHEFKDDPGAQHKIDAGLQAWFAPAQFSALRQQCLEHIAQWRATPPPVVTVPVLPSAPNLSRYARPWEVGIAASLGNRASSATWAHVHTQLGVDLRLFDAVGIEAMATAWGPRRSVVGGVQLLPLGLRGNWVAHLQMGAVELRDDPRPGQRRRAWLVSTGGSYEWNPWANAIGGAFVSAGVGLFVDYADLPASAWSLRSLFNLRVGL